MPAATAIDDEILDWLDAVYGLDSNTDQGITPYVPYYYQAGDPARLPVRQAAHLARAAAYRGQDVAESYVPRELPLASSR